MNPLVIYDFPRVTERDIEPASPREVIYPERLGDVTTGMVVLPSGAHALVVEDQTDATALALVYAAYRGGRRDVIDIGRLADAVEHLRAVTLQEPSP